MRAELPQRRHCHLKRRYIFHLQSFSHVNHTQRRKVAESGSVRSARSIPQKIDATGRSEVIERVHSPVTPPHNESSSSSTLLTPTLSRQSSSTHISTGTTLTPTPKISIPAPDSIAAQAAAEIGATSEEDSHTTSRAPNNASASSSSSRSLLDEQLEQLWENLQKEKPASTDVETEAPQEGNSVRVRVHAHVRRMLASGLLCERLLAPTRVLSQIQRVVGVVADDGANVILNT